MIGRGGRFWFRIYLGESQATNKGRTKGFPWAFSTLYNKSQRELIVTISITSGEGSRLHPGNIRDPGRDSKGGCAPKSRPYPKVGISWRFLCLLPPQHQDIPFDLRCLLDVLFSLTSRAHSHGHGTRCNCTVIRGTVAVRVAHSSLAGMCNRKTTIDALGSQGGLRLQCILLVTPFYQLNWVPSYTHFHPHGAERYVLLDSDTGPASLCF